MRGAQGHGNLDHAALGDRVGRLPEADGDGRPDHEGSGKPRQDIVPSAAQMPPEAQDSFATRLKLIAPAPSGVRVKR